MGSGIAGRCEVSEDGYEEQIVIPKQKRELADEEGISTENRQKVTVQILNLNSGESYTGRLSITGNHQVYLPTEIQELLKESGPPAMRDLRIYGKNRLLRLFRASLQKQIALKARAGRENLSEL